MRLILSILLSFPVLCSAVTRTFYIDYDSGSDSANGTSKSTPWKRQPYMVGWAGSYSHQAGDTFVFKGGVTWPRVTLPIIVQSGGTLGMRDTYTTDATWYTGASWARPIFDGEHQTNCVFTIPWATPIQHVNFCNLELKGMHKTASTEGSFAWSYACHMMISNCYMHDWTHYSGIDGATGGGILNGLQTGYGITNFLVTHCDIGNPEHGGDSGGGIWGAGEVAYCKIHDIPQGVIHGASSIHDCEFYNINNSYEPGGHANVAYLDKPASYVGMGEETVICRFYNNYIHDCIAPEPIYPTAEQSYPVAWLIYNNLVVHRQKTIDIDPLGSAGMALYIFNNTFVDDETYSHLPHIYAGDREGYPQPNRIHFRNNHFIGASPYGQGDTVGEIVHSHNLTNASIAAAIAAGYDPANYYRPTNSGAPGVSAGIDLSGSNIIALSSSSTLGDLITAAPRTSWDIGAFQFGTNVATPTFSQPAGTYTNDVTVTISCTTEGATIHYTTDGSTPNEESTVYTTALTFTATTTLKAIGAKADYGNSAVASATYTITSQQPAEANHGRAVNANIGTLRIQQ
jgi:hypothetical protein